MANEPVLDCPPRTSPSPLSLKAREHSSLSLKRIFDQINSSVSDRHPHPSPDSCKRFRAHDASVRRPSHSQNSARLAAADVDLRLATGVRQETRNVFSVGRRLQSGLDEASRSETSRFGCEREASSASWHNMRFTSVEPSSKIPGIDRFDANHREQEPTIDRLKKRAILNLQGSSMLESSQRSARASSPALSFQTQQSDASDQSLGSGFFRHIQENMQSTTAHARNKSSTASYSAAYRQSTAQLTIFYSGMVHVYDDVPADKAHAIMLLAGNDISSNSHFVNAPSMRVPATGASVSSSATRELGVHLIASGFSKGVPSSSFPSRLKQPLVQRSDTELPFARKASLARFLEKRKDRVQAKATDNIVDKDELKSELPASPRRLSSRPPSPASPPPTNSST